MMMTKKANKIGELEHSIYLLEKKKKQVAQDIKEDLLSTASLLKPSNVLHRVVEDFRGKSEVKKSIFLGISGIIGGFLSKKLLTKGTSSIKAKILLVGLQVLATRIVAKKV